VAKGKTSYIGSLEIIVSWTLSYSPSSHEPCPIHLAQIDREDGMRLRSMKKSNAKTKDNKTLFRKKVHVSQWWEALSGTTPCTYRLQQRPVQPNPIATMSWIYVSNSRGRTSAHLPSTCLASMLFSTNSCMVFLINTCFHGYLKYFNQSAGLLYDTGGMYWWEESLALLSSKSCKVEGKKLWIELCRLY